MTIETLLGLVNEGIADLAVVWKPLSMNDLSVGRVPSAIPCWRYSGSNPSTQTTTVGA